MSVLSHVKPAAQPHREAACAPTGPTKMPPGSWPVSEDLRIEQFDIHMPVGEPIWGRLYAAGYRSTGRRFVVVNAKAEAVYDTDECHDKANAMSKLDEWLTDELYRRRETPLAEDFKETVDRMAALAPTPPHGTERLDKCGGCSQLYPVSFLKAGRCPECPAPGAIRCA